MDAAKSRFTQYGFKKTTMEEICRDSKIPRKSIYSKFKGKEDILVSLFVRETLKMRKSSLDAAMDFVDPLDKIKQMTFRALEYFYKEPFFTAILAMNEEIYAPYKQKDFEEYVQTGIVGIINRLLKDGVERGIVRDVDTRLMAYIMFKIFQSLTYARTIPYPSNVEEVKEEYCRVFEIIKDGLVIH